MLHQNRSASLRRFYCGADNMFTWQFHRNCLRTIAKSPHIWSFMSDCWFEEKTIQQGCDFVPLNCCVQVYIFTLSWLCIKRNASWEELLPKGNYSVIHWFICKLSALFDCANVSREIPLVFCLYSLICVGYKFFENSKYKNKTNFYVQDVFNIQVWIFNIEYKVSRI